MEENIVQIIPAEPGQVVVMRYIGKEKKDVVTFPIIGWALIESEDGGVQGEREVAPLALTGVGTGVEYFRSSSFAVVLPAQTRNIAKVYQAKIEEQARNLARSSRKYGYTFETLKEEYGNWVDEDLLQDFYQNADVVAVA